MKNSQSKFSHKNQSYSEKGSNPKTSSVSCCCGSKLSDEIDEVEIIEEEEK